MFLLIEKMDRQVFVDIALARGHLEDGEDESGESSGGGEEDLVEILCDEKEGIVCKTFDSFVIHVDNKGNGEDDSGWMETGNRYFVVFGVSRIVVEVSIDYYSHLSMYNNELRTKTIIRVVDGNKKLVREYSNLWLLDYESHEWEANYETRTETGFVDNDDSLDLADMGEYKLIVEKCTNLIRKYKGELDIGYE